MSGVAPQEITSYVSSSWLNFMTASLIPSIRLTLSNAWSISYFACEKLTLLLLSASSLLLSILFNRRLIADIMASKVHIMNKCAKYKSNEGFSVKAFLILDHSYLM